MSYVDAFYNREQDMINVVERNDKGERHYKEYPARHIFYYPDPKGKFTSIFGQPLSRVSSKNVKEHAKNLQFIQTKNFLKAISIPFIVV